jgi:predicted extracellular nuclease
MEFDGEKYYSTINCNDYSPGEMLHFRIIAKTSKEETYIIGSVEISKDIVKENITSISTIQGNTDVSPFPDSIVTIAGRVNSNFDNSFFIQQDNNPNSGICVFGTLKTGYIGDSIVVTGKVAEYNNLTEMTDVSYCYNLKAIRIWLC